MLKIMITPTRVANRPIGFEQSFLCEYESSEEMTIKFSIANRSHPEAYLEKQNFEEDHFELNAYGGQRKIRIRLNPEIKLVDCILYNRDGVEVGKVTAMIAGTGSNPCKNQSLWNSLAPNLKFFLGPSSFVTCITCCTCYLRLLGSEKNCFFTSNLFLTIAT